MSPMTRYICRCEIVIELRIGGLRTASKTIMFRT
jgi:hypothetical protein